METDSIISHDDNFVTEQGHNYIKLFVSVEDIKDMIAETASESLTTGEIEHDAENPQVVHVRKTSRGFSNQKLALIADQQSIRHL